MAISPPIPHLLSMYGQASPSAAGKIGVQAAPDVIFRVNILERQQRSAASQYEVLRDGSPYRPFDQTIYHLEADLIVLLFPWTDLRQAHGQY